MSQKPLQRSIKYV